MPQPPMVSYGERIIRGAAAMKDEVMKLKKGSYGESTEICFPADTH